MGGKDNISKLKAIRENAKKSDEIPEIIGSHSVSCEQNLFIMYLDKCKTFMWKFDIKSNSNAYIHISRMYLLDDHLPEYELESVSINNVTSKLEKSCQLWENINHRINLKNLQLTVQFYTNDYGNFEQHLICEFQNGDTVVKHIGVQVCLESKLMSSLYFKPIRESENELVWIEKYDIIPFDGEPEISLKTIKYPLPPNIEDLVSYGAFDNLGSKLTRNNYKERLHLLLHIEEYQRRSEIHKLSFEIKDIRQYVCDPVVGIHSNQILKLPCDELQAEQMCQLIGKSGKALVKLTNLANQHQQVFEIVLEKVQSTEIVLEMSSKLADYLFTCEDKLKTSICFRFVDVFQCMHRAINNVNLSDVFPRHPNMNSSNWNSYKHPRLSKEQSRAFEQMTKPEPGPPVLILGPFGSGKTLTMATSILELLNEVMSGKANHKILICTHSNSAADHYIEDFIDPFLKAAKSKKNILIRVNWELRYTASVSRVVLEYCEVRNGKFVQPTKSEIEKYNVVVCTLVTADIFLQAGVSPGYFSHIFIDEAAQAMEVEAIIPLTLKSSQTKVILAGDHLQLGPYLSSSTAQHLGLGKSLLERLFQEYPLNSPFKLKLLENFRSFKDIVEIASALFYEGALLSNIERPDGIGYPLRFFGIHGKEKLSEYHPSYYNLAEADEVLCRIQNLKSEWPKHLGTFDATKICVLSCFSAQIQEIRLVLRRNGLSGVRVENVNNVQGLEFHVIILSTVRSYPTLSLQADNQPESGLGFLSNPKLLNTAITRAKLLCIFVGEPVALCSFGACIACWKTVIASCQQQGEFHYRLPLENVMEISDQLRQTLRYPHDDVLKRTQSLKAIYQQEQKIGNATPYHERLSNAASTKPVGVDLNPHKPTNMKQNFFQQQDVASCINFDILPSNKSGCIEKSSASPAKLPGVIASYIPQPNHVTKNSQNSSSVVLSFSSTYPATVVPVSLPAAPTLSSNPGLSTKPIILASQPVPFVTEPLQPTFMNQNSTPMRQIWPEATNLYFNPWSTGHRMATSHDVAACGVAASHVAEFQLPPIHSKQLDATRLQYQVAAFYVKRYTEFILANLLINDSMLQRYSHELERIETEFRNFFPSLPHFDFRYGVQCILVYKERCLIIMRDCELRLKALLPEPLRDSVSTGKRQYEGTFNVLLRLKATLEMLLKEQKKVIVTRHNSFKLQSIAASCEWLYSFAMFVFEELERSTPPQMFDNGFQQAAETSLVSLKPLLLCCIKLKFIAGLLETASTDANHLQMLIRETQLEQLETFDSSSSTTGTIDQEFISQFLASSDAECGSSTDLNISSPGSSVSASSSVTERFEGKRTVLPRHQWQNPRRVDNNVDIKPTAVVANQNLSYSQVVMSHSVEKERPKKVNKLPNNTSMKKPRRGVSNKDGFVDCQTDEDITSNLLSLTEDETVDVSLDSEVENLTDLVKSLRNSDSDVDEWFIDRASDPFVKEYIASFERHLAARLPSPTSTTAAVDANKSATSAQFWAAKYKKTPRYKPYNESGNTGDAACNEGTMHFEKSSSYDKPVGVVTCGNNKRIYFSGLEAINRALAGDKVRFELTADSRKSSKVEGPLQGRVTRVITRAGRSVLCKASFTEPNLMIPCDGMGPPIIVCDIPKEKDNRSVARNNAQKFTVRILGWLLDVMYPIGAIEKNTAN
eukprot:gene7704-8541_t